LKAEALRIQATIPAATAMNTRLMIRASRRVIFYATFLTLPEQ
jgi:hypothetical protein